GRLLDELAAIPDPASAEPDGLDEIRSLWSEPPALPVIPAWEVLFDRVHGAWLGRAAGCLLGKPVEKVPRQGIREILQSQQKWPLNGYFTAAGLPADVAERWPWNRASRPTSLAEVIDGMPEDDDTNYTMLALALLEKHGSSFSTDEGDRMWREAGCSRRSGLPTATSSRASSRPRRPRFATPTASGSAPRSGPTCTAGSGREIRARRLSSPAGTLASATPATGSTAPCSQRR